MTRLAGEPRAPLFLCGLGIYSLPSPSRGEKCWVGPGKLPPPPTSLGGIHDLGFSLWDITGSFSSHSLLFTCLDQGGEGVASNHLQSVADVLVTSDASPTPSFLSSILKHWLSASWTLKETGTTF